MALGRYKTAGEILNDAAMELGLITTPDPDPVASTDEQLVRLRTSLKAAGQDLAANHLWRNLIVEAVLTKTGGVWTLPSGWSEASTDVLDLPPDWAGMVRSTGWDRSNQRELTNLNVQEWQYNQAATGSPVWAQVRLDTNQMRLLPTPLADCTLALEYKSRAWVRPAFVEGGGGGGGLGNGNTLGVLGYDEPSASGDFVLFDRALIVAAVKLRWKREAGFDTTTAEQDALRALNGAKNQQTERRILDLSPRPNRSQFVGLDNLPEGNW